jgi:opacity protein-like surface antigen
MSSVQRAFPVLAATVLASVFLATGTLGAQALNSGKGYLMGAPEGYFAIHGGLDAAMTGGDLFSDVKNQLTLGRRDFTAPGMRFDLGFRTAPTWDVVLSVAIARSSANSEFRNFIDNNNQPIQQTTTFQRIPLTVSLKHYLTAPGRSVGRYAWVPARIAPFIGAGAGMTYYKFEQSGDFVDFTNNNVISRTYTSEDWGFTGHAFAGADITLTPRLALVGEARYSTGHAKVGGSFEGFNNIDLSGLTTTVGLQFRF